MKRRTFLGAMGSMAVSACNLTKLPPSPPAGSPVYRGRFGVSRAILGVTPHTEPMPLPSGIGEFTTFTSCGNDSGITTSTPQTVRAIIYYPSTQNYDPTRPISLSSLQSSYPVVIFAHAKRFPICPSALPAGLDPSLSDITNDFQLEDYLLDHVASHGFVVCAPDIGWLWNVIDSQWPSAANRARVLVALRAYLLNNMNTLFSNRLDPTRFALIGHSSGAAGCLIAKDHFPVMPQAVALVAPALTSSTLALVSQSPPLLVLKGTEDTVQGANPDSVYTNAGTPKIRVTIGGANHFGYTDVCTQNNKVCAAIDKPGLIPTFSQKLAAATYIAAHLRRYVLGDSAMTAYLDGSRKPGLELFDPLPIQLDRQGVA